MLTTAYKQISHISDNEDINASNCIESLKYIDKLYFVLNCVKAALPNTSYELEPTFKGLSTCEKYGITSTEDENKMCIFIIKPLTVLEDNELEKDIQLVVNKLGNRCTLFNIQNGEMKFIIK